jgi:hypothetical protein
VAAHHRVPSALRVDHRHSLHPPDNEN